MLWDDWSFQQQDVRSEGYSTKQSLQATPERQGTYESDDYHVNLHTNENHLSCFHSNFHVVFLC